MGRTERSQGLAPQAIRKDVRAKQARLIINKTIPAILASNVRARQGAEGSVLIVDPPHVQSASDSGSQQVAEDPEGQYAKRKGQGRRKIKHSQQSSLDDDHQLRKDGKSRTGSIDGEVTELMSLSGPKEASKPIHIRVVNSDTLTVASMLRPEKNKKKEPNVCILNMASLLRPGGGVLSGATSQEEFLCARTTLLPSLKDSFYRLPEIGGILTRDVLVFRSSGPIGDPEGELQPEDRFWVDVISAGMLRFPELEGPEDESGRLSKKDRILVEAKMRAVMRIAVQNRTKKLVLGAWGCGAYGNPVADVAELWQQVILGETIHKAQEDWTGIEEVVFAISSRKMAIDFAHAFGHSIEVAASPGTTGDQEDDEDEEDTEAELASQIQLIENQYATARFPDLKARLGVILDELKTKQSQTTASRSG